MLRHNNYKEMLDSNTLTLALIRFAGAVQFGSRALGVNKNSSDYDYAILRESYNNLMKTHNELPEFAIEQYFDISPNSGFNSLIQKIPIDEGSLDLLIIEHQADINIIKQSVEELKTYPKEKLQIKRFRVKAYEVLLEKNGFIQKGT